MAPLFIAFVIMYGGAQTADRVQCPLEIPGAYYRAHETCEFTDDQQRHRQQVAQLLASTVE